ncbi:ketopantoate reductase family protein [Allosalinactinospora lopnorensis]|uniref:ketopantoate reductase family protein n=1 Tax=Allosalinactinospora lopnorensis TaxID=1352348 RepID=UPI000623DEF5|nr:2-dehydropantoate 2-reductase [Allosalinactinospora lopnorensis]
MTTEKFSPFFTILGPGGVGGLLAGLLARRSHPVTVVAGGSTAARIASEGLRVESAAFGDFTARVAARPRLRRLPDASERARHVLFVAPKGTSLSAALDRVPPEAAADALIVPLLNGFEHMELLRSRYPRSLVAGAAIHVGAARVAPGHIEHTSPYTRVELAGSAAAGERTETLSAVLRDAGVGVRLVEDEERVLWEKYGFLLPTALVCAHTGLPIGEARVRHRTDMVGVVEEVAAVASARGVPLDTAAIIAMADERPAHTKPSMLFDRETGRPMELDPLGGALLRAAERAGVDTPTTARIVAGLRAVDRARLS